MPNINLMPWRQALREEKKKHFIEAIIGFALVMVLIIILIHMGYGMKISAKADSNSYLKEEITKLNKDIKKVEDIREQKEILLARMQVIQRLQQDRPNVVRLFDTLVRVVPGGVHYSSVIRKGEVVTIKGWAESNTRVSKLMRNMDDAAIFSKPHLSVIRSEKKKTSSDEKFFTLDIKQKYSEEEDE